MARTYLLSVLLLINGYRYCVFYYELDSMLHPTPSDSSEVPENPLPLEEVWKFV